MPIARCTSSYSCKVELARRPNAGISYAGLHTACLTAAVDFDRPVKLLLVGAQEFLFVASHRGSRASTLQQASKRHPPLAHSGPTHRQLDCSRRNRPARRAPTHPSPRGAAHPASIGPAAAHFEICRATVVPHRGNSRSKLQGQTWSQRCSRIQQTTAQFAHFMTRGVGCAWESCAMKDRAASGL